MKINIIAAAASLLLIFSCKSGESSDIKDDILTNPVERSVPDGHNAQNSLDWAGVYEGVGHCDNCDEIKTILRLNQDESFVLSQASVLDGKEKILYKEDGKFTWENNGSEIVVDANKIVIRFQVRENEVRMLDMKGNVLDAQLANFYTLTKK